MRSTVLALAAALALSACGSVRYADTAPSGTSLEDVETVREVDLQTFATRWLSPKAKEVTPRVQAAVEFQVAVQPPVRSGYRVVAGKEVDDAVSAFTKWCAARGGRTGYASEFAATSVPPGRTSFV